MNHIKQNTFRLFLFSLFLFVLQSPSPAQANTFTKLWKGLFGSKNAEQITKSAATEALPQTVKPAAQAATAVSPSAAAALAPSAAAAQTQTENSLIILESVKDNPAKTELTQREQWKQAIKDFYNTDVLPKEPKKERKNDDRILKRTQEKLPSSNPMKYAQIEEEFAGAVEIESAINRRILAQDVLKQEQEAAAVERLFSFRTGMEAVESLVPSYKELLSYRCTPEEATLLLNNFKELDKEFFYYNPSTQSSYMVPRTTHLYTTMFYHKFAQNNPTLQDNTLTALLDRTGLDKVLTVIDTKLWMNAHKGELPRFQANKTIQEQQVAINFYNLLDEAKNNALPAHLRPLKQVVLSIGKPIQGNIPLSAWTNFAGKWMATFSDEELAKIFLNYNKPAKKAFFDGMAADIRQGVSHNLASDKTGKTLYLLGTANATPQQTLSMLNWWVKDGNQVLPQGPFTKTTLTPNTDYAKVLRQYREGALFDNALRALSTQGQTATQVRETLLPLAQNYLRQTAQRLERAKQLLDQGEIKQADVKALHNDIQNKLLKELAPRETAQLTVQVQQFNKLYNQYNEVAKLITYFRMHPNDWYYEEGTLALVRSVPSLGKRWHMGADVSELQNAINGLRAAGLPSAAKLEVQLQRLVKKGESKN